MAKKLVKNYFFNPGLGIDDNARPNAVSLISQNRTFLIQEIIGFIQNQITSGNPDYAGYTYDTEKCIRDSGYVIDALIFDLRYNGNEETRRVSSFYWEGDVPQIDGSRIPEYEAYQFLRDLINNFILTNTLDSSPEQSIALQVIDLSKTSESNTSTRVSELLNSLVSVIQNGLSSLPELVIGLGRIELLDKIGLEDLLIISNVTTNEVIYNFAEPTKGGTTRFRTGNSEVYPQAISVSNGTTVINFKFNTSSMSTDDIIQVFLEDSELKVRPYDFGTDALERMRVAAPQAMLDADFEYGLQPSKWQAIGTQRGYPSAYEITGSDVAVVSVVTDASAGTSGTGASLMTVTTQTAHGFTVGKPFTIKALAATVSGFARAEGTFLVNSVPTTTTFTYYAKSKVGTVNPTTLATSATQLREADFYTGAAIGTPTITVHSNGSSGSFTTSLRIPSGSNTISYTGTTPPIGAPLSGTGIASGTQISGVFGSGGTIGNFFVSTTALPGAAFLTLNSVAGIQAGMTVTDGGGTPTQVVISAINGNQLTLGGTIGATFKGDIQTYSGQVLSSSRSVIGTGTGATFDISVTDDEYTVTGVNSGGSGYLVGDTVRLSGASLGGISPENDLRLVITAVSSGVVTAAAKLPGPLGNGTGTFTNISSTNIANPTGQTTVISVTRTSGVYSITLTDPQGGYYLGNRYRILGSDLDGIDTTNDLLLTVTGVSGTVITSLSISGTAARGDQIAVYSAVSITESTTAQINAASTITYGSIATIQIAFASNHGLVPGNGILVAISSAGSNHALAAGAFSVEHVVNLTTIRYTARAQGTVATGLTGSVYLRPDTFFTHRPYDGGVQLGTGGPQHGAQAIRQSKKYIRYQSGKGAMYNTGALFAPSFDLASVTSAATSIGSLMTVTTDDTDHGVQAGSTIRLSGIQTVGYNGDYVVGEVINERVFRVTSQTNLGNTTAELGEQAQMSLLKWKGAVVRSGPFDDQNGIFFQYDGTTLSVVRRSSTFQIAGTVSVNANSNLVTGTGSRFRDQLQEGDRVVIKGMTHVVASIASQTSMTVTPDFRGVTNISAAKVCKIVDIVIPQNEWNLDRCDGTGPSGYEIDVTTMQMIGIQFSWYGAGFIDWMFRGPNGDYVFCHRLKGNNLNNEAYMRTGNLPVRYEVLNEGARSRLNGSINDSATSMTLDSVRDFPDSGYVYVDNELISYSSKSTSTNQLLGLTRSATYSNFAAGANRSYIAGAAAGHNDNTGVILLSTTTSPAISHWGSAYLMDGRFDEDRGFIFNYQQVAVPITPVRSTLFLIRLAPSVSNASVGDLGERELINRAQLLLKSLEVTPVGSNVSGVVVEAVLNPKNYPVNPSDITWNGLTTSGFGGQPSFAQIAEGDSVTWNTFGLTTSVTATTVQSNQFARTTLTFSNASVVDVSVGMVVSGTNVGTGRVVVSKSVGVTNTTITLNRQTANTVNSGVSITFTLPVFAQPGQTVFSLVAAPGGVNSLDLNELNELTNTTIGGRGTFPNGPDVLAVNAYIASGTGTTGTIDVVLRWGEAQA